MQILTNPFRGSGLAAAAGEAQEIPSTNNARVSVLLGRCPRAHFTPLDAPHELAERAGVECVFVKDERTRMGLGSFKALGAAYVIAREAEVRAGGRLEVPGNALEGQTYVAASAGNHGLSVAAGAAVFGARAVIYLADTVPEAFAERLRAKGADVVREGADYEASVNAAGKAANDNGWTLISDSSWPGYTEIPFLIMEGYLAMADEAAAQVDSIGTAPTHIFLQAGVGGLAAAGAAHARKVWGDDPVIVVVEPEAAPALHASIRAGRPVHADGPVSSMGRLDCKEPSIVALAGLSRDADYFALISDDEAKSALPFLADVELESSPSGAAGIAALLAMDDNTKNRLGIDAHSRVLCYLSEGPEG
ncbi:diaminopropionate ammonia-lyase [Tepidamorphus sp. 3E244]|uniref:diaminopropionate ammonia-lyase n=1 Tax=Tepidamorphus sp. 3E244 TaxID=3385498 RepID=UPI0038FD0D24